LAAPPAPARAPVSSEGDDEDPQATIERQDNAERLARTHQDFMGDLQSNVVTAAV
jgi:hypothetical protein